jgi:hypothetical protein
MDRKLTRKDLTAAWTFQVETVPVSELGEGAVVCVRQFSAADRGKLEVLGTRFREKKAYDEVPKVRLMTCALAMCNDEGERLFQTTDADLDEIGKMPAAVVDRIFEAAARMNGLEKKATEEQEKNSVSAQS